MTPPKGFQRSHSQAEAGTWSDDGAQALCLLDCLLSQGTFSLEYFSDLLLSWYEEGIWAVGNIVFDVGIQTGSALHAYKEGLPPRKCGLLMLDSVEGRQTNTNKKVFHDITTPFVVFIL